MIAEKMGPGARLPERYGGTTSRAFLDLCQEADVSPFLVEATVVGDGDGPGRAVPCRYFPSEMLS